jgi:predicted phosphodiesterase
MKQVIIGDIHGRTIWKQIVEEHKDADRFIFVGDYVDSHIDITPAEQLYNLQDIISFKNDMQHKCILLVGNHDFHYWPGISEQYSGYNPRMRASFEQVYEDNKRKFQICFIDEHKTIYSHAGINKYWLDHVGVPQLKNNQLVDYINDMFISRTQIFGFQYCDLSGYGNDRRQGPLWIRPQALNNGSIVNMQVVGHTECGQIDHVPKSERRRVYLIDALENGFYLVRNDEEFEIKRIIKKQNE